VRFLRQAIRKFQECWTGPICAKCGEIALSRQTKRERVFNPEGRDLGWFREIVQWEHSNGLIHEIRMRAIIQPAPPTTRKVIYPL